MDDLADSIRGKSFLDDHGAIRAIIETPKGSRNKFAYDPQQRSFTLSRVLPAGMVFPLDFGFVPNTMAPDGDPVDVLVLMEEPSYPGIALSVRLIGILEGEQTEEDGQKSRNDRLLSVAVATQDYADIVRIEQIPQRFLSQIEEFFANYHRIQGRQYKFLGWKGVDIAIEILRRSS